jgi:phosphate uptake regulator
VPQAQLIFSNFLGTLKDLLSRRALPDVISIERSDKNVDRLVKQLQESSVRRTWRRRLGESHVTPQNLNLTESCSRLGDCAATARPKNRELKLPT